MDILELYTQKIFADAFNNPYMKGVITVNGFSFDIRIVNNEIYCNGLLLDDFFKEGMLDEGEKIKYNGIIKKWVDGL